MTLNNPYKIVVKLKQYAPLLHFQGDTEGACLRASEVKPKLDRFLWGYFDRHGIEPPESWLLKTDGGTQNGYRPALRYKMRFSGKMKKTDAHPLYFAQSMGGKAVALMSQEPVEVTIIALCRDQLQRDCPVYGGSLDKPTLREVIQAVLPAFFALNCFGARSGKGFGSFEVCGNRADDEEIDFYKDARCLKTYRLESRAPEYSPQQCQDDIYVLSGMMKGGFNQPYFKGEVQKALYTKNLGSDKAFIKQKIFPHETVRVDNGYETLQKWYEDDVCHGRKRSPRVYPDHRFVRAMLGLADHYSYGVGKKQAKSIVVSAQNPDVKRFANPVRFKPCQGGFRIIVWEIPDELWGACFDFSFSATPYHLKTPQKKEFNLVVFIDYFLSPLYDNMQRDSYGWDRLIGKYCKLRNRKVYFSDTLNNLELAYEGGRS